MVTEPAHLQLLLAWMNPAFPTGAFAYSHGLEWAISAGHVHDAETAKAWIATLISQGSAWNDAVLFARCWEGGTDDLNELALALASSKERREETTALGRAFAIAAAAWLDRAPQDQADIAHPIAAARACIAAGIPRASALLAYLNTFAQNQISVAVRLVPLGQTAGLTALRDLGPLIAETAAHAETGTLGSFAPLSEIAAMKHETLETRIFRT